MDKCAYCLSQKLFNDALEIAQKIVSEPKKNDFHQKETLEIGVAKIHSMTLHNVTASPQTLLSQLAAAAREAEENEIAMQFDDLLKQVAI